MIITSSFQEAGDYIKRKSYQDLCFTDDFMFGKVLGEHTELCKKLAEIILDRKIGEVLSVNVQDFYKTSYDSKAVILDVHFEDDMDNICTIEMQVANQNDLVKRSRYYLSTTDVYSLNSGDKYDILKNNYFVMICLFDLFGEDEPKYWFENYHIGRELIRLNDGRYTIFLNASCTGNSSLISPELREFLHFIMTSEATGALTSEIDNYVHEAKYNRKWERDYMLFVDRLAQERREGYDEGSNAAILKLLKNGKITYDTAAEELNISLEELEELINKQ